MKKLIHLSALIVLLMPCLAFAQLATAGSITPTPDLDKLIPGVDCLRGHVYVYFKPKQTADDVARVIALMKTLGTPKFQWDTPILTYDLKLKDGISIKKAILIMIKDVAVSKSEPEYVDNRK